MKLVNFRRLKSAVGHERVNEKKLFIDLISNDNLLKIKFTLIKIWTGNNWLRAALQKLSLGDRETIRPCGASKTDLGDRETVPGHQGAAVVPADSVAVHEIERPETHWLVRTECKK